MKPLPLPLCLLLLAYSADEVTDRDLMGKRFRSRINMPLPQGAMSPAGSAFAQAALDSLATYFSFSGDHTGNPQRQDGCLHVL